MAVKFKWQHIVYSKMLFVFQNRSFPKREYSLTVTVRFGIFAREKGFKTMFLATRNYNIKHFACERLHENFRIKHVNSAKSFSIARKLTNKTWIKRFLSSHWGRFEKFMGNFNIPDFVTQKSSLTTRVVLWLLTRVGCTCVFYSS